jgi:hypothetical protein
MLNKTQLSDEVWYLIPEEIKQKAFYSINEVAWYREDAIKVLKIIHNNGFGVIGIDIWIPSESKTIIPFPSVYDLDLSNLDRNNKVRFSDESFKIALQFVNTFGKSEEEKKDLHGKEPLFNIWDWVDEDSKKEET